MNEDIKLRKEIKRKEYNSIRYSNSSVVNEKIKSKVKFALEILIRKYHVHGNI